MTVDQIKVYLELKYHKQETYTHLNDSDEFHICRITIYRNTNFNEHHLQRWQITELPKYKKYYLEKFIYNDPKTPDCIYFEYSSTLDKIYRYIWQEEMKDD